MKVSTSSTDSQTSINKKFESSVYTRIKNHYEALRSELGDGKKHSSEYDIANCRCCKQNNPNIPSVWSQENYKFLEKAYSPDDANDTNQHLCVHPNLWENGASNHLSGVFEVLKGKIYQVRGYDMSNLTFVRSNPPIEGCRDIELPRWIVFDTLMSNECTDAAMKLFEEYLKETLSGYSLIGSIVGMIISHSHIDHYGGMETVAKYFPKKDDEKIKESEDNIKSVENGFIIAPAGFYDHSVSENVYLGNAMSRRASYQYGSFIKPNDATDLCGEVSIGIGQGQSTGHPSAVGRPTIEISENTTLILDKIKVEFQLTPGTEAPAEMNNYIPEYRALWLAENCSGTLHNLYTLRGAEIRDAKAWAKYLMETAVLYGDKTDVIFQSHNWPHWNDKTNIRDFIIETAAIYKYIHDQTLLYMNMGYKMDEVADMLVLPRGMQKNWSLKPFYGTPVHNAKAVYQKYLGWYDANPLHLQELPPEQLAKETLRYAMAGNRNNMLNMIRKDIELGNYWTAAYMSNQMILSGECDDIANDVKDLCASALQQLGSQSESGTWRNAYLSAAYELRNGKLQPDPSTSDQLAQMPPETLLDYISIFFDGERTAFKVSYDGILKVKANVNTNNLDTYFAFVVKNGAILYYETTADKYNESVEKKEISLDDLQSVAKGTYKSSCDNQRDILCDISNAQVIVANTKRFKYFDIISRHDSQVSTKNYGDVDLKTEVKNCIALLEEYVNMQPDNSGYLYLKGDNKTKWDRFYDILKRDTMVILDGDFFVPGDKTWGIGIDGKFKYFELYYTLYSLYRYLYRSYLKNDYGYKFTNSDKSVEFVKLKQSIVLLETYVADFYLYKFGDCVKLEDGDALAWHYLNNENGTADVSFSVDNFFGQLYYRYKKFSNEINCVK